MDFLIGTYTDHTDSAGIYALTQGPDGRLNVAARATIWLRNASYLVEHPSLPLVYAVSEIGEAPGGQVAVLRRDNQGNYEIWQAVASGGLDPCHLSVSTDGRALLISHYSSGSVVLQGLSPDGGFKAARKVMSHEPRYARARAAGRGLHPRQAASHVHSATFLDARQFVVCDLGTDEVLLYHLGDADAFGVTLLQCWTLPAGSGPRHIASTVSPRRLYVVAELSNEVFVLAEDEAMAPVILSQLSCLADDGIGLSDAAEITLDPTYKALWVSNRGQDGLVRMPLSSDDLLPPTVWTDVGAHPRHFWMSKHWLLIAAKNDGVVRVIMRDEQGVPDFESAQQIKIPSPVFILPLRQVGVETS